MKITGIIFLIIGFLALGYLVFDLFDPNGRDEVLPFLSQTWSAILASFLLGAGAALLVAAQPKYRGRRKEKINS
ncbi:hypothetical protein WJR50_15310 [Catalinimonas sp. 4WD22]|jgi:hypothetical protein|uniref:hypothetical protein n=1 Tax=Catalinimonas locisalis TaxID=3133978 RepID=UPI00310146E4